MCILIAHLIVLLTINLISQIYYTYYKKKIIVKIIICTKCLAILYTEKTDLVELTKIMENERSRILVKFTTIDFWLNLSEFLLK